MSLFKTADFNSHGLSLGAFMRKSLMAPFYKQHAGSFLFLFVLFLGSFMFINYLGKMSAADSFFWHFILMIFLVTHQFMVLLFLAISAGYMVKSRLFIKALLTESAYFFLKDSLGGLSKRRQWWKWFELQIALSLPLLIYGLACLAMAMIKGVVIYGIVITVSLMLGMIITASLNYRQLICLPETRKKLTGSFIKVRWNLTRWMAFIYCIKRQGTALLMTKLATIVFTLLMVHWQREDVMTGRQWWLSFLLIGAGHVLIAFKLSLFMDVYCKDLRALPLGFGRSFLFSVMLCYLLLLLPELLILSGAGYPGYAAVGYFSEIILLFFFHYFSAYLEYELKSLLKAGFLLLCLAFVLTLYGLYWLVLTGYLVITLVLYGRRYYCLG